MFKSTNSVLAYVVALSLAIGGIAMASQPSNGVRKTVANARPNSISSIQIGRSLQNIRQNFQSFLSKAGLTPGNNSSPAAAMVPSVSTFSGPIQLKSPVAKSNGYPGEKIIWSRSGVPREIIVTAQTKQRPSTVASTPDPISSAEAFLNANKDLLQIKDPNSEFSLMAEKTDKEGFTHVRFKQMYHGIDVWAKDIYVHISPEGQVLSMNGTYAPTPELTQVTPAITSQQAISAALNDLSAKNEAGTLSPHIAQMMNYSGPTAKEVIWYDKGGLPHLTWFVQVITRLDKDWYYFIDASDGVVLHRYNNVDDDGPATGSGADLNGVTRTFGAYLVGSNYYMIDASEPMFNAQSSQVPQNSVGAIETLNLENHDLSSQDTLYFMTSTNDRWSDASAVSAEYNAITTYNFYRQRFGRNSIDNSGMTIYSIVHVTSNGQPMDNAFWSGNFMCYGDGNVYFKPLAGGLDVATHELTHGVTQHTANLVYENQSGALNESESDCFACLVDSTNWTIGEGIIKDFTDFPTGALRDMANPNNGGTPGSPSWQPANMSEYYQTTNDNGGVHTNSGIPNHAFYLVATAIGRDKAGFIWYKALTEYLTSSAQFVDARIATEQAAAELYGNSGPEVSAVSAAWDSVQVYESTSTPPPASTQLVGQNWVLAVNTASSDVNSIYMVNPNLQSNADISPLSQTPVLTRPAVSDTSGLIIFVGTDYRLYALDANALSPNETVLDTSQIWWSVAIGPGLNSLALTSRYVDTTVYYIDFTNNVSKSFKITNQAYDGPSAQTALYASSLSFDPTGRYVLLDVYNQVNGPSGDTISYWDIDKLDVTTGTFQSVFSPQPQGIDLADPAYSKESPYRFAFDYWNENTDTGYVMAANFYDGTVGQVTGALQTFGDPTYSSDDTVIAYHTLEYSYTDYSWHDAVEKMPLDTTGLNGLGTPEMYLVDATDPVWFVIGSRLTGVQEKTPQSVPDRFALYQNYPNPFNPTTVIRYQMSAVGRVTLKVYDILGRDVRTLVDERESAGNHTVTFNASNLPSGVYFYRLEAGSYSQTKKLVLLK